MAVFDPNECGEGRPWLQTRTRASERRRPEEINREVTTRWLGSLAMCLCFAVLVPAGHLLLAFGGLLIIASLASACLAVQRQERFDAPHLTAWDEAAWSFAAGLAFVLWGSSA